MKLRRYRTYMSAVRKYARAVNLEIRFRSTSQEGVYYPLQRRIVVDARLSPASILATVLHELGHDVDFRRDAQNTLSHDLYCKAVDSLQSGRRLTRAQKRKLLEIEVEAWCNARMIAKQLRIPLGQWFSREESASLQGYSIL